MSVSPGSRTPSAFSAISVAMDARRRSRTRERTAWMRVRVYEVVQRRTSVPLGVERSLERRTSVQSAVPAVLARYLRRRKRNFCIVVNRDGDVGVGFASGCGVGWFALVEEGMVVESGCESSMLRK